MSPNPTARPPPFLQAPVPKCPDDTSSRPLPLPSKAGTSATAMTVPIKPLVDKMSKPAAFTKPSATVTPTLKSTGVTSSSAKSTVFTTAATKSVSTSTIVPSNLQFKNVEKGEASSTTCSPKPDSIMETSVTSSTLSSQDTDSDPNVSSTTGLDTKKKLDLNKDIKTIKKEFDSLTSFKEKKELGEELFAPTATIIQQIKPKLNKIEKRPPISSKFDIFGSPFNDLRKDKPAKDKIASKDKKDKLKAKQRFQTNDLKDFLAADNKSTVKKTIRTSPEKKPEIKKDEKVDKVDAKRRLSTNAENEDLEPRTKIPKLKPDSDTEPEAKKVKTAEIIKQPMGRIPKIEKKERERTESVKSQENFSEKMEKDKNKPQVKPPKSKHHDREKHRHKSKDESANRERDKHKKKKKDKDKDKEREKVKDLNKAKLEGDKSRSFSVDEEKQHHRKLKKSKDKKEKKENRSEIKDKIRDKEKKEKYRDKDKEKDRKRKKEDEERRKQAEIARKKKKLNDSSNNSDDSNDSSDDDERKFSIFDEPVFDENNPVYFSMYDKVKARRSCVKAREEEEHKRQEAALAKFAKLKEQRAKREGKKKSVDSENDSLSDVDIDEAERKLSKELKIKKKQSFINSSSDSEDESNEFKKKRLTSKSAFKTKRTVVDSSDDEKDDLKQQKHRSKSGLDSSDSDMVVDSTKTSLQSKHSANFDSDSELDELDSKSKIKSEPEIKSKIKTETEDSDVGSHSKEDTKPKSSSISDTDEVEDSKSAVLSVLAKTKKKEKAFVKSEPLSTDTEDEKPDVTKFPVKREQKRSKIHTKEF